MGRGEVGGGEIGEWSGRDEVRGCYFLVRWNDPASPLPHTNTHSYFTQGDGESSEGAGPHSSL